jgi:hypothetical protein
MRRQPPPRRPDLYDQYSDPDISPESPAEAVAAVLLLVVLVCAFAFFMWVLR